MRRKLLILFMTLALLCGCSIGGGTPPADESLPPPPKVSEEVYVYCFNAGKADAHLIYNSQFAVLIDCGEKGFGKVIAEKLGELGIKKLDMLIVTHFDKDHVGGAAKVLRSVGVGQVIQSNSPKDSEEYREYTAQLAESGITPVTLRERLSRQLGSIDVTVYPPARESYPKDPSNNSSLITLVRCGECSMLFAGDAEDDRLYEFMQTVKGGFDLLKVPYHGHQTKRTAEFLKYASPKLAVITSSDEMPEDAKTVEQLQALGTEIYLTREGAVSFRCDGKNIIKI